MDQVEAYGVMPGTRSREPVGGFLDKFDGFRPPVTPRDPEDVPEIEETSEGIAAWRHPEALLLEHRELWPVVSDFRSGLPRELTERHLATRSAWWVTAWSAMCTASHRRQLRDAEQRQRDREAAQGED